jgi:hypothetical protein
MTWVLSVQELGLWLNDLSSISTGIRLRVE